MTEQKTILTQADSDIILDALKNFPSPDPDFQCKYCKKRDLCPVISYKSCEKVISLQEKRKDLEQLGLLDAYDIFAKVNLVLAEIDEHQKIIEALEEKRAELISNAVKFKFAPPEASEKLPEEP